MFGLKVQKSPVIALVMALGMMMVMFMVMEQLLNRGASVEEEILPEPGRSPLDEALTEPFMDRWGEASGNARTDALKGIVQWLAEKDRESLLGFLIPGIESKHLASAPGRYIGRWTPLTLPNPGGELDRDDAGLQWIKVDLASGSMNLGVVEYNFNIDDRPLYVEMIFLGQDPKDAGALLGVAPRVYELPKEGHYPTMESDRIALMEVVDEFDNPQLHKMTRNISPRVLSHYFAKVQRGEHLGAKVTPMRYSELMESPDVFRGQWTSFTGRLLYRQRRLLSAQGLPPGLDFYEEGYLLNSDRVPVVFRCPRLPAGIEVNDIVTVKGYFLQRFNFKNRLKQATWAPMIIAGEVIEEQEQQFGVTKEEGWFLTAFLTVVVGVISYLMLRPRAPAEHIRVKPKVLSPPKKRRNDEN